MTDIITLENIDVTFKQGKQIVNAVKNVNLNVEKGDVFGVVGYSGAGKSTLVRTINLLQKPTSGTVKVNGTLLFADNKQQISNKELQKQRRSIGMIFQHFNLLNETTVVDNVAFALRHSSLSDKEIEEKALNLLKLVGLEDKAKFYPIQLSGGEQQRVAIARALANDPEILISDESTSALDPRTTNQILDLLKELNAKLGLTIVLITHEMDAVKRIANKIAIMEHGVIIEKGKLRDVYLRPKEEIESTICGGSLAAIETLKAFNLGNLSPDQKLFQLVFSAANVTKSIILELYKELGLDVSMLYGNIEVLESEPVGTMFILAKGEPDKLDKVADYLKKENVEVTRIDERGFGMTSIIEKYLPNVANLGWTGDSGWWTSIIQTLYMTLWPAIFGGILGLIFGIILVVTKPKGILESKLWFSICDKLVSLFRAVPFIILLAVIAPVTKLIVGTQIGTTAAIVPLSLGVFPFYARQVQVALESVNNGKVEAAQALGATNTDIILDVYLREARSELVRISTVTLISLVGLTAMAGAIGAGGLGNTAISYGYNRFNNDITIVATLLVLLIVIVIQLVGDFLANILNHQKR